MKKLFISLFFILNLCLMSACQQDYNNQETPLDTASELRMLLTRGNANTEAKIYAYHDFTDLFMDDFKNNATKEKYQSLVNVNGSSNSASLRDCVSITLENGAMLLVYLYQDFNSNQYEIIDIVVVPQEYRAILQELGL